MKTKAFSLIEIIVAVAIIATLSGIVGLKLKDHVAKSKDTQAIASLNTIRTAIQIYQLENSEVLFEGNLTDEYSKEKIKIALNKLEKYLESNSKNIINNPEFEIGGSQNETDKKIIYGGKVRITFKNPDSTGISDGYSIWLEPFDGTKELDIRGNKWIEY
ncbi:MAG: prepilin-type N-terminal cleavage/methylation domain-containing protein [Fusobacterium gastrosuis]|uniref:prepilin-type N-terminal cleavage/methylation domain-containing protein n=1 Tax=Fusobacterium gastrosuis TaxID=1755100 RepID=UPI002A861236|nr:prepilin-type N-terminal cleavage/methylation domain-containing protein [Fusobacteriaceae bacterium]MDY4010072.1 prepilin-type N-terminal cleavage/methylation domain-containing protein [Fusobacterium gastrosuis]MDY5795287.1 prepilin-type N-terminal cleavage/methylation domain-containing protein [Fusobacterium gastrosuis]